MIIQSEMDDHENVDTVELIQCEDGDDQIAREDDEVMPFFSLVYIWTNQEQEVKTDF